MNEDRWQEDLARASDALLEEALTLAHVPALMAALTHFLGSTEHLAGDIAPLVVPFAEEEDGLSEEQRGQARAMALEVLRRYRDSGCPPLARPEDAAIRANMDYVTGEPVLEEHVELLWEELNLFDEDRRRVVIDTAGMPTGYRVLVIGAGMSGILAAVRLKEAGIPFQVIEKNPEVSGTWYENTYPGCKVDSPNHLYNYIFAPENQWPGHFSGQKDLNRYFKRVVDEWALLDDVRLGTRVLRSVYDEVANEWEVTLESGSARWEHEHDLAGKRVAVIGTGCSATQFVPAIADQVGQMKVFQRTPNWLMPAPEYRQATTEEELWCFRNIPFYAKWYRFFLYRARALDGFLPFLYGDRNWDTREDSISPANDDLREAMTEYIREQAGNDPMFEQLVPNYPPGGKRPVLDDGAWISALMRDNVELVTEGIERITVDGIVTGDGQHHPVDVLIYGTGFSANQFLVSMDIVGRGGVELHEQWRGDARAYLGITVPNFPNFYCLYGPNTNIVVGSSIIFFSECEMRYIMGCLKLQLESEVERIECRQEVHDSYNADIDALNLERAWGAPNVSSWYKSASGRVSQNWPGTHFEFWRLTRTPDPGDFLGT
jgi:4-hydroxyacetophenone monooxygenase